MKAFLFPFLRILIGLVFLVSGFEKALSPYQNFLYVIQGYQFLPLPLEIITAQVMPWIELLTGIFLVCGLWTPLALKSAAAMFAGFVVVVSQALIRGIDLSECGCFGSLIHIPPPMVLVMDSWSLLICLMLYKNPVLTRVWSLDARQPSL